MYIAYILRTICYLHTFYNYIEKKMYNLDLMNNWNNNNINN